MVYELQKILGYTFLQNDDLRQVIKTQMQALVARFRNREDESIDKPIAAIIQVFDPEWERTHLFCKYDPGN